VAVSYHRSTGGLEASLEADSLGDIRHGVNGVRQEKRCS
jgi:hypothetical protein